MTKIPCGVVEDLLPLYLDGLCGEESRALVAEHLELCPACRDKYERARGPAEAPEDPGEEEPEERQARAALKKAAARYLGAAAGSVLLLVVLCLTLFMALGGPAWLCEEIDIPAREIALIDAQVGETGYMRLRLGADSYYPVSGGGILPRTDENGQRYHIAFFWAPRYAWLTPRTDGEDYACVYDSSSASDAARVLPGEPVYAYDGKNMILLWDGTEG